MCSLFPVSCYLSLSFAFLINKIRDKQQQTENKKHIVELALIILFSVSALDYSLFLALNKYHVYLTLSSKSVH